MEGGANVGGVNNDVGEGGSPVVTDPSAESGAGAAAAAAGGGGEDDSPVLGGVVGDGTAPTTTVVYFACFVILLFLFLSLCRLCVCVSLCSHWSLVDVPLIFFCPADHVPDWQPRVLLGMVEARSVNVKKTTTTMARRSRSRLSRRKLASKRKGRGFGK